MKRSHWYLRQPLSCDVLELLCEVFLSLSLPEVIWVLLWLLNLGFALVDPKENTLSSSFFFFFYRITRAFSWATIWIVHCAYKWSRNIYFDGSGMRYSSVSPRPEDVSQQLPGNTGKSEMYTLRCSMHKKPKIVTVVGGWGFSASRLLFFRGSSQPLTPDTNKILTKVLVLKRPGEVKVGFILTYWAVPHPFVQFLLLEVAQKTGGSWDITLIKQWIWFSENSP